MTSQPQDPEYTSEPKVLSPVSPKPVYYPVPSNIPILENQIDPVFNQTATHMAEAASQQLPPPLLSSQQADAGSSRGQPQDALMTQAAGRDGHGQASGWAQAQAQAQEETLTQTDSQTNQDSHNAREDAENFTHQSAAMGTAASDATSTSDPVLAPSDALPSPPSSTAALPAHSSNHDASLQSNPVSPSASSSTLAPPIQGRTIDLPPGVEMSNLQNLLDHLSRSTQASPASLLPIVADTAASAAASTNGAPFTLPPRPPPQQEPSIDSRDIRDFHPHSHQAQQNGAALGYGSNATGANGMPPPPVASFQQTTQQKLESQREMKLAAGIALDEDDTPWTSEIQQRYDYFLSEERKYVTEGNWEQFPFGSRLFVGNLSSERVTKRDIFHVFHKYGHLAQISIKQAYGFVQFLEIGSCTKAIQAEQGKIIRGKKIHLEVSKPQKNRVADTRGSRRSRSPNAPRPGNTSAGSDRYAPGDRRSDRDRDTDRNRDRDRRRGRDDYRPGRSPSPQRPFRSRDRSRDRYDTRYRSRSRSPHYGRAGRIRSPSPRRRSTDDDLPLPRRAPRDVPDVQIIVLDELDRNFIAWLEQAFTSQAIRVDVLLLSPRLSEAAVVRRQILEGVLAVSRITRVNQQTAKIPLQVFDRRQGVENIRFEEYDNLDPTIAAQLVLRAKAAPTYPPPQPVQYGYGAGVTTARPNISNMITSLDPSGLQKLLGVMQPPVPHPPAQHQPATALTPDLAKLLGSTAVLPPPPQPHLGAPPQAFAQTNPDPLAALRANPALASLLAHHPQSNLSHLPLQISPPQQHTSPQQQSPRVQPDMADILAKLGSYRR